MEKGNIINTEKIAETGASEDKKVINNKNDEIIEPAPNQVGLRGGVPSNESKVKEDKGLTKNKMTKLKGEAKERARASGKENKKIPEKKLKAVEELKNLAETKKTILIASIKNLPASQFQEICKKLRGKAIVKVPNKNISLRALDSADGEEINKLKKMIDKDIAILFSDLDAFELAGELINSKSYTKSKPGQEAPEDIIVEEGPTDLMPGPAVSEFGALGIQISIENGKINIKKEKIIVKKGNKISEGAADIMNKLDIKPFMVGFEPIVAFDTKEKKLYTEIKIDREGTLNELKIAFGKALPFAIEIGYICEDTIKFLISKAGMHEKALEGLENKVVNTEVPETESKTEPSVEEKKDVNSESNPEPATQGEENAPQLNSGEQK